MTASPLVLPQVKPMAEPESLPTTHWSLVLAAGRRSSPQARQALETLCRAYWQPLYAYLRRRLADPDEAQDVTQAFFTELLDKHYLHTATPARGRFRAFLLTACQHFLSKHRAKAKAQKRGGGRQPLALDVFV
jgi:RNA polymerase sigma-70 factor (ECF subfamily)